MTTATTFCMRGGVIGGTRVYRPVEPWERDWGHWQTPVLCSHLVCRSCSVPVRSIANHALRPLAEAPTPDPDIRRIDFAGRRIDLVTALRLEVAEDARTFACACRAVTTRQARSLAQLGPEVALPWGCAGHPKMTAPGELDGQPLPTDAAGWLALCHQALSGTWSTQHRGRDVYDDLHPAFRLAHVLLHLVDAKLQAAIGKHIAPWGLMHDDPHVRQRTLDFYVLVPRFAGFEALAKALTDHRALYDGFFLAGETSLPLGDLLRKTISSQIKTGPNDLLSHAVRMDLTAGHGFQAFINATVRDAPGWVIDEFIPHTSLDRAQRQTVTDAMQTYHPGLAAALRHVLDIY